MNHAKHKIATHFASQPVKTWSRTQLSNEFERNRTTWLLDDEVTLSQFIDFVLTELEMKCLKLGQNFNFATIYCWGNVDVPTILQSAYSVGYFSHATAAFINGLLEDEPSHLYFNIEQPAKPTRSAKLEQSRIDAAFKRPVRSSNNVFEISDRSIHLLSGKNTGQLGVVDNQTLGSNLVRATNTERTLIDLCVRPLYTNGPSGILKAFRAAIPLSISIRQLVDNLRNMDFAYPYHQAIGFYCQRAGFPLSQLEELTALGTRHRFYLDYELEDPKYDDRWCIYYPPELDEV